jgi:hypothetical protein
VYWHCSMVVWKSTEVRAKRDEATVEAQGLAGVKVIDSGMPS